MTNRSAAAAALLLSAFGPAAAQAPAPAQPPASGPAAAPAPAQTAPAPAPAVAPAPAPCPTALGQGLVLKNDKTGVEHIVQPALEGMVVRSYLTNPAKPETRFESTSHAGVFGSLSKSATSETTVAYDKDPRSILPLKAGAAFETGYTVKNIGKSSGKPDLRAYMVMTVLGADTTEIGTCKFETLHVRRVITFENFTLPDGKVGVHTSTIFDDYAPSLGISIKTRSVAADRTTGRMDLSRAYDPGFTSIVSK